MIPIWFILSPVNRKNLHLQAPSSRKIILTTTMGGGGKAFLVHGIRHSLLFYGHNSANFYLILKNYMGKIIFRKRSFDCKKSQPSRSFYLETAGLQRWVKMTFKDKWLIRLEMRHTIVYTYSLSYIYTYTLPTHVQIHKHTCMLVCAHVRTHVGMPVFIFMNAYARMSVRLRQCTLDWKIKKLRYGNYWWRSFKETNQSIVALVI